MPMEIHEDKIVMRAGKYDLRKPWVSLTPEERKQCEDEADVWGRIDFDLLHEAIDAKLKEKNFGG